MKKILGLDLGTNSIGWCLIEIDETETPQSIVAMGSRIIPLDSDSRDQFQKGQAISKNHDRTIARTQRKGYNRKQLRKSDEKFEYSLINFLKSNEMYPSSELLNLNTLDLWKLRADAVDPQSDISPKELGRILYMLAQKRGYKSARGEANQDKKDTDYVATVKSRHTELKENHKTIGQYFYSELKNANNSSSYFRIKDKVYPREAYMEEFDAIMDVQKKKHAFLSDSIIERLRNQIIFYQRKLKSQKGLVNVCEFEGFETTYIDKETQKEKTSFVGPKVTPRTSPLNQLCIIWENINNLTIKVRNPENVKYRWRDYELTSDEKERIAEFLSTNAELTFAGLLKILNLKKEDVYANKQIKNGIKGNSTYATLKDLIGESKWLQFEIQKLLLNKKAILVDKKSGEITHEIEAEQINPKIELEPLYQLWHTIYSIKDIEECKSALQKRFGFDEETSAKLAKIDFNKQAFGSKSNKAIRKILPYLMQGFCYSDACEFAGYNHSNSLTKDEQSGREIKDKLELLPKNSLRQPVVEKILNQMIHVVNAINEAHGKPDEIRVELARELKQSKDEREDADKSIRYNTVQNKEIEKRLIELGIPATKKYVQKYKYIFPTKDKKWKEQHTINQCIYCGQSFSLSEALTGDNFDVDHIIPKSLLFDDSQRNKVLVHRSCNKNKTNTTAYDYISSQGEDTLNAYIQRVDDWFRIGILSYSKAERLKVSYKGYLERKKTKKETEADKKIWENFINRQLRETQYIARKSREILSQICRKVYATEGTVTAKIRQLWGWDDVLMNLQLNKYKAAGQTEFKEWESNHGKNKHKQEVISNWTKRDDHRHHAIDALVIACTRQGYIQRLNTLNTDDTKDEMRKSVESSKVIFREKQSELDKYLISQRPEKFTTRYIEHEADKILVSFKAGKKVTTSGIRKVKINGKKKVIQTNIIIPRGALHEQFVYGKIKVIEKDKNLKFMFNNSDSIVNTTIQNEVKIRLNQFNNDIEKALTSLKKEPIYLDQEKKIILEKTNCYKEETVLKYPIQNIRSKDIPFIVDEKIKQLVKERLEHFQGREIEAFKTPLWFNEEKHIPIITVRLFTKLEKVEPVKKDLNGKDIGFALTKNNHHVAIYKDLEGNYNQHLCTFWHAVERKKNKIPVVIKETHDVWSKVVLDESSQSFIEKLPNDNLQLMHSLQQNEMFVLGMMEEDFELALKENRKNEISKKLYLVWSIGENQFWFRHHLETKNSELKKTEGAKESKRFHLFQSLGSFLNANPIKVKVNHLGEITKIGE